MLSLAISAAAALDQGSRIELDISFRSQVEPKQAGPGMRYQWSDPDTTSPDKARSSTQSKPASTPAVAKQAASPDEAGVTFFFTAPATTNKWDDFLLNVKCINKSSRPRHFSIVPVNPKRPRLTTQSSAKDADEVAGMFQAPLLEHHRQPDTFCHTPDQRIGPLAPGASSETAIELRAMTINVLDLGTFRIGDLDTKETVEVKDLPDVVAFEALEGSKEYGSSKFAPKPMFPKMTAEMEAMVAEWDRRKDEELEEWYAKREATQNPV